MLQIIADETNDKRNVKEEPLTDAELDARDDRESSLSDLDAAQVAMARLRTHMNSFVVLNMFPQMMYRLECKKPSCKFVTRRISHQPELSLTVSQDTPMSESLENLIRHDYGPQSRETVDSTCAKCKREGRGEDGHRLLERKLCYLPEYLVVTLMRYHADPSTGHIRKHLNRITFPESGIDMSEYFIDAKGSKSALLGHRPNPIYDCYAVLEHIGERARAGHYYTFARSLDKAAKNGNGPGAWHLYNDRSVTKREFADIEAHNVAVIFLKRRPINR
jgi:ubiquitin C-terminal hydrolase